MKKRGEDGAAKEKVKRSDSDFDSVIDKVLEEQKNGGRRDDFSDDDDDDMMPDRNNVNPLKDFTFVGGGTP